MSSKTSRSERERAKQSLISLLYYKICISKIMNYLSEELVETTVAVWLVILFFECTFVQLLQTKRAHKVLGMEFPEHRCYAAT